MEILKRQKGCINCGWDIDYGIIEGDELSDSITRMQKCPVCGSRNLITKVENPNP